MASKRPEPPLTEYLASWPRQRQEARGGMSAPQALDPSICTLVHPTDTLVSFNYRPRNRRKRKKSQRSDLAKRFSFKFWPVFESWPEVKAVSVYRCKIEQRYANTDGVSSSKAASCADLLGKSFRHIALLSTHRAKPSLHLLSVTFSFSNDQFIPCPNTSRCIA